MYKYALPLIALGLSACATQTKTMDAPMVSACEARSQAVFFDTASTSLDGDASATMNNIAALYNGCDLYQIEVVGYADSIGGDQANLALSDRRADAVLQGLMARGVTADRARIVPLGERTAPTDATASEFERRVVVTLVP